MTFDWTTVAVSAMTAGATLGVGRAARRTPRQERRDDFKVVTEQQSKAITRLGNRVDELETDAERDRARAQRDRQKMAGQDYALRYITAWVRDLVGYIRRSGLEPPLPPQPVPDEIQPYMHDIGV